MTRRAWCAASVAAALFAVVLMLPAACSRRSARAARSAAARVVSLAPSTTEGLFAIGAGDRVVGRSAFDDQPPQVLALPAVGGVQPDLEAILALRPDLVVGVAGLSSANLAGQLAARGIDSWFPEPESLSAIDAVLVGLGERTGRLREAKDVVARLDARESAVERSVAGEPRPSVLMVASAAPIIVAGPKSFIDEVIRRAGGRNVVDQGGAWPALGLEKVIELDPDVILDASAAHGQRSAITRSAPGWDELRAVREGRVVPMSDERVLHAGPRIAEGLAVVARALHPRAAVP